MYTRPSPFNNKNLNKPLPKTKERDHTQWPKYAILFSYTGTYFYGLQLQARLLAIQNVLWEAMRNLKCAKKFSELGMHFASRTDRNVHALRNLMITRVDPRVIQSSNSGDLSAFCEKLEQEVKRVLSKHPILPGRVISENDPPRFIWIHEMRPVSDSFCAINHCKARKYLYLLPRNLVTTKHDRDTLSNEKIIDRLNLLFGQFQGEHSFHNFAGGEVRVSYKRTLYYVGLDRSDPMTVIDGSQFFVLRLHGEGFMKHHIRGIIGLVAAVMRNKFTEDIIPQSLLEGNVVAVPEAPGIQLILEEQEFDDPLVAANWSSKTQERINEFQQIIFKEIVRYEKESATVPCFLYQLQQM